MRVDHLLDARETPGGLKNRSEEDPFHAVTNQRNGQSSLDKVLSVRWAACKRGRAVAAPAAAVRSRPYCHCSWISSPAVRHIVRVWRVKSIELSRQ